MKNPIDTLFSSPEKSAPFRFDRRVAEVFPDMIKRSVPGYGIIIDHIEKLAKQFTQNKSNYFDLGCSLGAASLAMSKGVSKKNCNIIAIDNSLSMLERCQHYISAFKHPTPIELQHADILDTAISNAAMAVLNFTLQFIPNAKRNELLKKIYEGLKPDGILVLSEKITFENESINQLMIDLHHTFKKENGYSDLEISQKRNALENVLRPESLNNHLNRLKNVGFSYSTCWFQQLNFVSILAIK